MVLSGDPVAARAAMAEAHDRVPVRIKRLRPDATLPTRAHEGDAGWDLYCHATLYVVSNAGPIVLGAGIAIELPPGYEAQVRPRSGRSLQGIHVALGTIDSSYRGEIKVVATNLNPSGSVLVQHGDRIAQLVIQRVPTVEWLEVDELGETERGANGFGSSDRRMAWPEYEADPVGALKAAREEPLTVTGPDGVSQMRLSSPWVDAQDEPRKPLSGVCLEDAETGERLCGHCAGVLPEGVYLHDHCEEALGDRTYAEERYREHGPLGHKARGDNDDRDHSCPEHGDEPEKTLGQVAFEAVMGTDYVRSAGRMYEWDSVPQGLIDAYEAAAQAVVAAQSDADRIAMLERELARGGDRWSERIKLVERRATTAAAILEGRYDGCVVLTEDEADEWRAWQASRNEDGRCE